MIVTTSTKYNIIIIFVHTIGGVFETIQKSFKIGYEVIKNEGIFGLCTGMGVFSFKRFCDWITRYFFVEMLFYFFEDSILLYFGMNRNHAIVFTIIGLLGGVLSALSTLFLDVLVALLQDTNASNNKDLAKNLNFSKAKYGMDLRILHVSLTVVLMKNIAPIVAQLMANYIYGTNIDIDGKKDL